MNAYELAQELEVMLLQIGLKDNRIPKMIRQQADRIAELEKGKKCIVKDCENHRNQGGFTGDLCNPCHEFITTGKGKYSQAYRNTQTKPLSDEEILDLWCDMLEDAAKDIKVFVRAIEERHGIK